MYAGEHFSPWSAKIEILTVQAGSVSIIGSFKIEDPNYYDQRAKDITVEFEASFLSAPVSEIWSPI